MVNPKAYEAAWRVAAPEQERQALIPEGWFETWESVTLATDPESPVAGTIWAPAGAVRDTHDYWTAGNPLYDPSAISCPVLVICAEWDIDVSPDMAQDLFLRLTGTRYKRLIEIGAGTHMILMEKNREQAFDGVIAFLDDRRIAAASL
jgi:alpha-beta hydrolase superfamily lysophospholipase